MSEIRHSILFDGKRCVACVACTKACPSRAIRVRGGRVHVNPDLCIDCGECIRACPHDAMSARTSSPSDLKRFRHTVAIPSTTLFTQFGGEVHPSRVLHALTRIGFDSFYDMSWMCEMVGQALDAYLSECKDPWPKISVSCPAVIRLIQIRYPDLLPHLAPIESPRELTAKLIRRRLAQERGFRPEEIGIFYITPCSAIMHSIVYPVGLEESYLDGAFSVAEVYGPLRMALEEMGSASSPSATGLSPRGLGWAAAGGESAMMRNANTLTVNGVAEITHVFDRIEAGKFRSVDYIEAYICPEGCVSGPLLVEGWWRAKRNLREVISRLGRQASIQEEKTRMLFREHFFDLEEEVKARALKPIARDLKQAILRKREKEGLLALFPGKNCAACGAPDCATLAEDILEGSAVPEDCVFVKLDRLSGTQPAGGGKARGDSRAKARPGPRGAEGPTGEP